MRISTRIWRRWCSHFRPDQRVIISTSASPSASGSGSIDFFVRFLRSGSAESSSEAVLFLPLKNGRESGGFRITLGNKGHVIFNDINNQALVRRMWEEAFLDREHQLTSPIRTNLGEGGGAGSSSVQIRSSSSSMTSSSWWPPFAFSSDPLALSPFLASWEIRF